MLFALLYAFFLVVPGWATLSLLRMHHWQYRLMYPVASLGWFIGVLVVFHLANIPLASFTTTYITVVLLLTGIAVIRARRPAVESLAVLTVLSASLLSYAVYVGPYVEVPGDPLWHIAQFNAAKINWANESAISSLALKQVFTAKNYYWYQFVGWTMNLTQTDLEIAIEGVWIVNFMVLTSAFYIFAKVIFKDTFTGNKQALAAGLAVILLVLHFGIGPFSYLRYYSFAPAFIALTGYWSVMIVVWRYLCGQDELLKAIAVAGALSVVTLMLHQQEALFIGVTTVVLVIVLFFHGLTKNRFLISLWWRDDIGRRVLVCLTLILLGYLITHVYLYLNVVRNDPLEGGWLTRMSTSLPILTHLFVLKPDRQFFQILTMWGVWSYLIYFVAMWRHPIPPLITAGMLTPLFTVFNPVFVDFFLRLSWPEVIWRLCYVIPLALFMAMMVVHWISNWRRYRGWFSKLLASSLVVVTVALLLPGSVTGLNNRFSKLPMLGSVAIEADHRQIQDLIVVLNEYSPRPLLTDQITGYILNAFTPHRYTGHKFYGHGSLNTNTKGYALDQFTSFDEGLLVINQRRGSPSKLGPMLGHWPENIRFYADWYSREFIAFVEAHPENFELIHTLDGISVYNINNSL